MNEQFNFDEQRKIRVYCNFDITGDNYKGDTILSYTKSNTGLNFKAAIELTSKVEDIETAFCADGDGDGYLEDSCGGMDPDDSDDTVYPGATELCDGLDNDVDGTIDEGFALNTYYLDFDSDNYGDPGSTIAACAAPPGYLVDFTDCDDSEPLINPGETEICDDLDNDCIDGVDNGCPPRDLTSRSCNVDGSATGGTCSVKNEDTTDATYDSCLDGVLEYLYVEDIFVDATAVYTTDTVQVTCEVCCYQADTQYAIFYNSGSEWVNLDFGDCTYINADNLCDATELQTFSVNVDIDDVVGTHYFRCWTNIGSGCDSTDSCCMAGYHDHDDISLTVY